MEWHLSCMLSMEPPAEVCNVLQGRQQHPPYLRRLPSRSSRAAGVRWGHS
jgi:hypothetical protein